MKSQTSSRANLKNFVLLDDTPYTNDNDPFTFNKYAAGLTKLIRKSKKSTPLTIGIQAPWGMGKSTLMFKLKQHLDKYHGNGIHTLWFNAWIFEGKDVLEGLIKSVLEKLDSNILRKSLRNQKIMAAVRAAAGFLASKFRLGKLVDDVWEAVSKDPRVRNQIQTVLKDSMIAWINEAPVSEKERLLIVFIDDLDRCEPANVFRVFEAIKLYLDAPGFVFIIGFDQGIISEAILEQKKYSEKITSRHYIEKIIQIDYNIPRPDEGQIQKLFRLCVQASRTEKYLQENEEKLIVEQSDRNPRRIKRFINRFILEQQLGDESDTLAPELLIKILMIQLYFRDFYALFHDEYQKNLISEFLDYLEVSKLLKSGSAFETPNEEKVDKVLEFYHLGRRENVETTLRVLEESVPEEFNKLARNNEFVSLIESITEEEERELLTQHILRKRATSRITSELADEAEAEDISHKEISLAGLRILWVYGRPNEIKEDKELIEHAKELGGRVEVVADGSMAASFLKSRREWVQVIFMHLRRKEVEKMGFEDIKRLQADGIYEGPVILYVMRVTPLLRKEAEALGVYGITNNRTKALEMLQSHAEVNLAQKQAL
ncbi:MAG: P-loop NTPase fold protein [bacterium]